MFSSRQATNFVANFIVAGAVINLAAATAALGQTMPTIPSQGFQLPADVIAALSYPSNSQRFFEEGRAQLEQEIQMLSATDGQNPPLLTLQPEVLEQFEEPSTTDVAKAQS